MTCPRSVHRNERGATAILIGVLSVVLVGISAFTLDFGRAYVSKRQLQTGADAGALAAASYYAKQPGNCATLAANTTFKSEAEGFARAILVENRPNSVGGAISLTCNINRQLVVNFSATGTTPVAFGGVYGVGSITTQRTAEATLDVPTTVKNLRPYMICSRDIPEADEEDGSVPDTVTRVEFGGGSTSCPTANNPGNWWSVDCPVDGNGNNGTLDENTLDGCDQDVSIVPDQPEPSTTPPNTALRTVLLGACDPDADEDCLSANPGLINGDKVRDAWNSLVGDDIFLPVFCGDDVCDPAAVTDAGGNNTRYPLFKFVGVKVCGWHFASQSSGPYLGHVPSAPPTDPCYASDASLPDVDHLLLSFHEVLTTGTTGASTCGIGDPCDGKVRRVRLTR